MTDYRCPSCDGGFPTPADECPWCGEAMDGSDALVNVNDSFGDGPAARPASDYLDEKTVEPLSLNSKVTDDE